jgi:hypothetical protein
VGRPRSTGRGRRRPPRQVAGSRRRGWSTTECEAACTRSPGEPPPCGNNGPTGSRPTTTTAPTRPPGSTRVGRHQADLNCLRDAAHPPVHPSVAVNGRVPKDTQDTDLSPTTHDHVSASIDTVRGKVSSEWHRRPDGRIDMDRRTAPSCRPRHGAAAVTLTTVLRRSTVGGHPGCRAVCGNWSDRRPGRRARRER